MISGDRPAVDALNLRFLLDYPREAARQLEAMPIEVAATILSTHPAHAAVRAWEMLTSDIAVAVAASMPAAQAARLFVEADPRASVAALAQLDPGPREQLLSAFDPALAREMRALLEYPPDSAGRFMDPRVAPLRADLTAAEARTRLRAMRRRGLRELFAVDGEGRLTGRVEIQDLATADASASLREIAQPPLAVVTDLDPREDVVAMLEQRAISELPVVAHDGRLVGVIHQAALMSALAQETTVDIQTMVGASRDERALSSAVFAVRKRLPWMQINLLTAFLAAAVVGLFENVIAQVTALAVLLPVVAGQSGNAGAQALAVTMRGLVLREISLRHWPQMVWKEASVGLINGVAVALTTAVAVWVWSRSVGLVTVISSAMVISMVMAGIAGALVPIVLRRFGQDPAQSSSIVLTTVTDVTGLFSFLGIATVLAAHLG